MRKILQLHLTLRCDLNCDFCFYEKRDEELSLEQIDNILRWGRLNDFEILKISGGGEPTLHKSFIAILQFAHALGYIIYLQTHGKHLTNEIRKYTHDIRISFGDGNKFEAPNILPNGFSYVVSITPDYENLGNLVEFAILNNCYVRITQMDNFSINSGKLSINDIPSIEKIAENLIEFRDFLPILIKSGTFEERRLCPENESLIRFWDAKNFHTGKNPCPCFNSPLYGADDYFYPCCKTHCAKELTNGYNKSMRLGRQYPTIPYNGSNCKRCYY